MIDIVAITDRGFVMPTGVMMYSVCVNNRDVDIVFHVIADETVTQKDRDRLSETVTSTDARKQVKFYEIESQICKSFPNAERGVPLSTYYRLFITEKLPQNISKVLFLDGDIVVRHSLLPLWETDVRDYAIAAVTDYQEGIPERYDRLKYDPCYGYFNAGVLLINLDYWRANHVLQRFNDYITTCYKDICTYDQDVLNVIFKDRKVVLPFKFNLQSGVLYKQIGFDYKKYKDEVDEAIKNPVIVHFTSRKPWDTPADKHPFSSTFFKYQSQTIWKGQRTPDKRTAIRRLRGLIGNVLRTMGILPPVQSAFDYIEIAPID